MKGADTGLTSQERRRLKEAVSVEQKRRWVRERFRLKLFDREQKKREEAASPQVTVRNANIVDYDITSSGIRISGGGYPSQPWRSPSQPWSVPLPPIAPQAPNVTPDKLEPLPASLFAENYEMLEKAMELMQEVVTELQAVREELAGVHERLDELAHGE